jgi:Cu(I)/Ag(I) efflux system membrane fusion protein
MKTFIVKRIAIPFAPMLPLVALLLVSCRPSGETIKPAEVDYYTCTMHPSVRSQDPTAKCPICSMPLVPVLKKTVKNSEPDKLVGVSNPASSNTPDHSTEFSVPIERQQQIGVTHAVVTNRHLTRIIRTVGSVSVDKGRHWDYVARVEGYVEQLLVFSRGEKVAKDAPLLTLYSPDLLTAQTEFVDALKTQDELTAGGDKVARETIQRLVNSATQRLRLWNLNDAQIAELERTRQPQERLTLTSPFAGVVQDISVDQGRRVVAGDQLVDVADLSLVWVWAQFYENELSLLTNGLPVTLTTSAYPGEKFTGKISLLDPFLNEASRTARVRIDVDNAALKLRPEMYVDVELQIDHGNGLAVPVSAVLPTGARNLVFVDRGDGRLDPRYVALGQKYGDAYEVLSGLQQGDRVVTSANFLIDAEAKVQGALKSW